MKTVGLVGVASALPETVVTNDFFAAGAAARARDVHRPCDAPPRRAQRDRRRPD